MLQKKVLLVLLCCILLVNSVFAVWLVTLETSAKISFTSNNPSGVNDVYLIQGFEDFSVDTTNGSVTHTAEAIFNNEYTDFRRFKVYYSAIKEDVEDNCLDYLNDITITNPSYLDGADIVSFPSGTILKFLPGQKSFKFVLVAKANSCPQAVDLEIHLEPAP